MPSKPTKPTQPLTHEERVALHKESVLKLYQELYLLLNHKRDIEAQINDVINAIAYLEK